MFATTTILSPGMQRVSAVFAEWLQRFLTAAGVFFLLWLGAVQAGVVDFPAVRKAVFESGEPIVVAVQSAADPVIETPPAPAPVLDVDGQLNSRMRRALNYVARRYNVSNEALVPIFSAAQHNASKLGLDPLLIIAVIGIESRFNPFSQSVVGAQGLMQVMPTMHADKLPDDAGELPFFDPVTNVLVGSKVLKESIVRGGGLVEGLQQFGGASSDPERRYASKVLSEHQRLQAAVQSAVQTARKA